jgi:hypothetical protein
VHEFVTFRTDLFNHENVLPHFINPCCFGEDLIAWLRPQLDGLPLTIDESIQEDYGWGFWAELRKDTFWVFASTFEPESSEPSAEWGIGIQYDAGLNLWRRLFHKPNRALQLDLCQAIDAALRKEPRIQAVEWWTGQFQSGVSSAHPVSS